MLELQQSKIILESEILFGRDQDLNRLIWDRARAPEGGPLELALILRVPVIIVALDKLDQQLYRVGWNVAHPDDLVVQVGTFNTETGLA